MTLELVARYASPADLASHVEQHRSQGAVMLPLIDAMSALAQFERLSLSVRCLELQASTDAEVLQLMPGFGVAVRLEALDDVAALCADAAPAPTPQPPTMLLAADDVAPKPGDAATAGSTSTSADTAADDDKAVAGGSGHNLPAGMGPALWPIEKLLAAWSDLPLPDKIHVARHGKFPARRMILKQGDKKLQQFLLQNPQLGLDEVAAMAAMPNLDPGMLTRIAGSSDWTRNSGVVRALVSNPKVPLPQVLKLINRLSESELRQLSRTGRVRDVVKRAIVRKLSGGKG